MKTIIRIITGFLFFLEPHATVAQENFVSTGEEHFSPVGSITYTVGQVYFQQINDDYFTLNSGVQIPYSVYIFKDPLKIKLEILVYPNPTIDKVTIYIKDYLLQDLCFKLLSLEGKVIESGKINQESTQVNMEILPTGTYVLNVVGWVVQGNIKIIKK